MKKKWEIEKLKNTKQLKKSADIILSERIRSLLTIVSKYFENPNVKNLHGVRIALRRVRYSMELFIVCYDKKLFLKFYNKVQTLQDLSGLVRDVDISIDNINSLTSENQIKIEQEILQKASERKYLLEEKFKLELMKFTLSKSFKDFFRELSK